MPNNPPEHPDHLDLEGFPMPSRIIALILTFLAAFGLVLTGCGSSDENNPANPGGSQTLTLTGEEAEDFATSALSMVNELVDMVPDFAAGDFDDFNAAKSNDEEITWDPVQSAYVFDFEGPVFEMEPPNYWTMSMGIWVQYRDAMGSPMQFPVGAVEMEMDYDFGMHMHMQEDGNLSDMEYLMSTSITVAYLGEGESYAIDGSGSTTVEVEQVTPQQSESGQFTMEWSMDITTTPDGCPSGTATVNCQDFTLNATYDGQGGVNWTLSGTGYQASGNEYAACGQPVN
jgi:hypothetical protein